MKALVLKAANTAFVLEDLPDPVPGPGEAVARVLACGSGLTIQHAKAGRFPTRFPRVIGHEITAEIAAVGGGVADLKPGDAVTAYFYINCGHCRWCIASLEPLCENPGGNVGRDCDGGYAQYIKLPARLFIRLPEGLDHRAQAAEIGIVTDALATPYKVLRRGRIKAGETVVVFGAGGGLGIHMVMMARWAHARVIAVDVVEEKFDACRAAGAEAVVHGARENVAEALLELTRGRGVDVAVDFVSTAQTLKAGAAALGRRGRLLTLGGAGASFQADARQFLMKELEFLGSRYVTRLEVIEALELVARGEIQPLVTEKVGFEGAEALHQRLEQGLVTGRAALMIA
jgi:alcohol dehydrogenase, propanol-preferring